MAEADWERLITNALDELLVSAGTTTIGTPPDGTKCIGYHMIQSGQGFAGHICALTSYTPVTGDKGGSITACMRKFGPGDHSPVIFFADGKDVASARGYILGLSGEEPSRIVLKKGNLSSPLLSTGDDVLAVSDADFPTNPWIQLSLFVTVNAHGEVGLAVRRIDPVDVTPPIGLGVEEPGIATLVDDNGGIISGSVPLAGPFYVGHGCYFGGSQGRKALFDYTIIGRQTAP